MNKNQIIKVHKNYHLQEEEKKFWEYSRNRKIKEIYTMQKNKKKLLDVGCGSGLLGNFFIRKNYDVFGIELDPVAAKKAKNRGVKTHVGDVQNKFPYKAKSFDEIFLGDIIEHIYFPEALLLEIRRVLKPGGRLVISTVNYSNIVWRLKYLFLGKIPISEAGSKYKNLAYWEHIRLWDQTSLINFINKNKFEFKKVYGTNYFGVFPKILYSIYPKYFSGENIYVFIKR